MIVTVTLTQIDCGMCGGSYAISERYRQQREQEGTSWHCPYCQISWGYREGENARLKKQLAQEKHRAEQEQARLQRQIENERDRADRLDRRRAAAQGQVTKIKNRVSNGVCPCCNRTFQNLQRHMTNQHPDWTPEAKTESAA